VFFWGKHPLKRGEKVCGVCFPPHIKGEKGEEAPHFRGRIYINALLGEIFSRGAKVMKLSYVVQSVANSC